MKELAKDFGVFMVIYLFIVWLFSHTDFSMFTQGLWTGILSFRIHDWFNEKYGN